MSPAPLPTRPANTCASGYYTIRAEQVALQVARVPQFYVGCAQLFVYSTGGSAAPAAVAIPGYITGSEPALMFDLWGGPPPAAYAVPGPAVYVPTNSGGGARVPASFVPYEKTNGQCVVNNANWCAQPLPAFRDEVSCYASSGNCYKQLDACYSSAPVTGHKGCTTWEEKCNVVKVGRSADNGVRADWADFR